MDVLDAYCRGCGGVGLAPSRLIGEKTEMSKHVDDSAERAHCVTACEGTTMHPQTMIAQRAAVRAECQAEIERLRDMCARAQRRAEEAEVRALNAERENERLKRLSADSSR